MWSVGQALPKILGYVVHLFRRHRPKSGETFAMEMSIFALYRPGVCDLWSQPWSGSEKKSPARRTKGKADYRDAALPFSTFLARFCSWFVRSRNRFTHRRVGLHVFHPVIIHDTEMTGAKRFRHGHRHLSFRFDDFGA